MTLYEFSEKYRISLRKTRRMAKDGVLRLDREENEAAAEMRLCLSRGQRLSAHHLLALVEEPSLLLDLGPYADRAEQQVSELGDAKNGTAPKEVAAYVSEAASPGSDGHAEAVKIVTKWMKEIIPAKPVPHSYIAVRLLLGIPSSIRKFEIPRIPRAMLNCRQHPDLNGWWRVVRTAGRNISLYQRPQNGFDL